MNYSDANHPATPSQCQRKLRIHSTLPRTVELGRPIAAAAEVEKSTILCVSKEVYAAIEERDITYTAPVPKYEDDYTAVDKIEGHPNADAAVLHDVLVELMGISITTLSTCMFRVVLKMRPKAMQYLLRIETS